MPAERQLPEWGLRLNPRAAEVQPAIRPGSAFTRVDQDLPLGVLASMRYSPGSTGSETPHSPLGTRMPFRFTSTPLTAAASGTVTVNLASSGSSASAAHVAFFSRSACPAAFAASAASRYVAHAVAVFPIFT